MPTAAFNLLVLMADELSRKALGCYGHPEVLTPELDALARRGTLFTDAYTTSPICVPARAAFATGRYVHRTGFWDNSDAYDGSTPSWHHELRRRGRHVASIGKLHFRSADEDHGFDEEIVPMHIAQGKGSLIGTLRDPTVPLAHARRFASDAGPGESDYTAYDRDIARRAKDWLRRKAPRHREAPWALFVSFVSPHFPLICPVEHFERQHRRAIPLPKLHGRPDARSHPYVRDHASSHPYGAHFRDDDQVRRALAAYYGLCGFVDEQVGEVLRALDDTGLADSTRVVVTSDHGDNLGARGLWGKSTLYEEAVGVPLILAGPGIPCGQRCSRPVGHVDLFPFFLETVGVPTDEAMSDRPGVSPLTLAADPSRAHVHFSEFHASGSKSGAFMVRVGRYKYIHHIEYPAELFDLEADPEELVDIARDPSSADALTRCREALHRICDPAEVDRRAKARQAEIIAANGGREAILARGDFGNTPAPGREPRFG